jgi:hypothetical protein
LGDHHLPRVFGFQLCWRGPKELGLSPLGPSPREGGKALDGVEEKGLVKWAQIVDSRHDPAIDIAVRRIMLALLERMDAADSLVDAVIALENLFGVADTKAEVTFRVTTAAAHLLEPDPAQRRKLSQTQRSDASSRESSTNV